MSINTTTNDCCDYFIAQNRPLRRLWSHRSKKFLYAVLKYLPLEDNDISIVKIVDSILPCVINLMSIKLKLKINLYDASIACLWKQLIDMGLSNISIRSLLSIAKSYLNHKTSYGRVIRILSYMRKTAPLQSDNRIEVLKYLITFVDNLFRKTKNIIVKHLKQASCPDSSDVRLCIIDEAKEILMRIPSKQLIGIQKRVVAAALLYALLKHKFKVKITSAIIENVTGLSRFTILRRYNSYLRFIEGTKNS